MTHLRTRSRRSVAAAAAGVLALAALPAVLLSTSSSAASDATQRYIVMTKALPLASYNGGVQGITATSPDSDEKLDATTANAQKYSNYLEEGQADVLAAAGIPASAKEKSYTVAFNGFSAELTVDQAAALKSTPGVVNVWKDEIRYADTTGTPDYLGLSGRSGVWQQQFRGQAKAGETVIVGVLDSGIWPENPSFAALPNPRPDAAAIAGKWHGVCDAGTDPQGFTCNNKLIGARYYATDNKVEPFEFVSPRDYNGHGSHTAGTAAGNLGVAATINGDKVGTASGMAPAARIAAYKVLWATPDGRASGSTAGILAAIDDAVADGVDVINYSISGSTDYVVGPDEMAFMAAADAGVFISTSAGNEGDQGTSTVAHNAPWTMTVAASTHNRGANNSVVLGNGKTYPGLGQSNTGVGPNALVDSEFAGLPTAVPNGAKLCLPASDPAAKGQPQLDPAKVTGKIVVCTRGVNARVDKSRAVQEAGGLGMILVNVSDAQSLNADFHVIPTSHVNATNGAAIKAYIKAEQGRYPKARITPRDPRPVVAPEMAGFSSWGPAKAGGGDLLKPDITAPGVDVIAAVAPPGNGGNDFMGYSGTSMSAPHISGLAALLIQKYPDWSPMWIKSAMMTTATDKNSAGQRIKRNGVDATPLDYGNGHVSPAKMFSPGLVYSNGLNDWLSYACSIGQLQLLADEAAACAKVPAIDPSDLNYPSMAVGALAGSQTITRTVTSTSNNAVVYRPVVEAPPGTTVTVTPNRLLMLPGTKKSFQVTITRTTAPANTWAFGALTWQPTRRDLNDVRSSIAIKPVAVSATDQADLTGAEGATDLALRAGYTGKLNSSVYGLVPAEVQSVDATLPKDGEAELTVPAGTKVLRIATYDADLPAGTDIDLKVYNSDGRQIGASGSSTSQEMVQFEGEDLGGTYYVVIDYFAGATDALTIPLNVFSVTGEDKGNLVVTPASQPVTNAGAASVHLAWSGLTPGTRYLGTVNYSDGTTRIGRTVVAIQP